MAAPLEGFRILDISERSLPAAIAGMVLADLGAEVIRVEPQGGNPIRAVNGTEVWFRGQKSVVVGPQQVRDGSWLALRGSADVVFTTDQPWTAKPSDLLSGWGDDPRQILAVITAFPRLPSEVPGHSLEPVYGELVEAMLGLPYFQDSQREGPVYLAWPHAAYGTAWLLQIATLAALFDRERTGQGQTVTTSLVDGLAILSTERYKGGSQEHNARIRSTIGFRGSPRKFVADLFECANNEWVQVHTGPRGSFERLLIALERFDLVAEDTSSIELPQEVADELWDFLEATFKSQSADHWMKLLNAADVCCMPVLPPGDALWLEQIEANQMVDVAPDGTRQLGKVAKYSRTPMTIGRGTPEPGEHTHELLQNSKPLQWAPSKPVRPANSDRVGPLDGVTVLDFGIFVAGPFSPRVFADLGARVIKVEETTGGPLRRSTSGSSINNDRGKEGIAINLKLDAGQALAHELVKTADVVHHNLRARSVPNLGIDYETIKTINPNIIYLHSTGYGSDGPWSHMPSLEPLHSAMTGLLVRTGGPGNPPAHYLTHMDFGCALLSTISVLAGLIERERSGQGQKIEVVQSVAGLYAMSDVHGTRHQLQQSFAVDHEQHGHAATNAMYPTRDGWVVVSCYCNEEWQGVRRALGINAVEWPIYSLARNQALEDSEPARLVTQAMALFDTGEIVRRLRAEGVPHAPLIPVTVQQTTGDSALHERHVFMAERHPEWGDFVEVGHTMRFGLAHGSSSQPAPTLGQDTVRILRELNKTDKEIESLISTGAVFAAQVE